MVKKEIFKFLSSDNKTMIKACKWQDDKMKYKAIIQIIHGMVENIDRYDEFAHFLARKGFLVIGHDHLGHGDSICNKDDYGYFGKNPGMLLLNDVHKLRLMFDQDCPYFIIGHSMGSFILRRYLTIADNLSGGIIIGTGHVPPFITRFGIIVSYLEAFFLGDRHHSKLLVKLSNGKDYQKFVSDGSDLERSWLTKDQKIVKEFFSNPKCQFIFTDNGYRGLFQTINYCSLKKNMKKIPKEIPLFIASGLDDPVGGMGKGVEKVYQLYQKVGLENIKMKLYPNDRHEILNEIDRYNVYNDILNWLNSIIK